MDIKDVRCLFRNSHTIDRNMQRSDLNHLIVFQVQIGRQTVLV
jgi:hypothetical protein